MPLVTVKSRIWRGRSPSWGAWIEIRREADRALAYIVAPPRGERGLKCPYSYSQDQRGKSLPLVGSVD